MLLSPVLYTSSPQREPSSEAAVGAKRHTCFLQERPERTELVRQRCSVQSWLL